MVSGIEWRDDATPVNTGFFQLAQVFSGHIWSVGVSGAAFYLSRELATGCDEELLEPVLALPDKIVDKLTEWTTTKGQKSKDRTSLGSLVAVTAVLTLIGHQICVLAAGSVVAAPVVFAVALALHTVVLQRFYRLGREGVFDSLILRNDVCELHRNKTEAANKWMVCAFVIASLGVTALSHSPILAAGIAYPFASIVYTAVKRYFQMSLPKEEMHEDDDDGSSSMADMSTYDYGSTRREAVYAPPAAAYPPPMPHYRMSSGAYAGPSLASYSLAPSYSVPSAGSYDMMSTVVRPSSPERRGGRRD